MNMFNRPLQGIDDRLTFRDRIFAWSLRVGVVSFIGTATGIYTHNEVLTYGGAVGVLGATAVQLTMGMSREVDSTDVLEDMYNLPEVPHPLSSK